MASPWHRNAVIALAVVVAALALWVVAARAHPQLARANDLFGSPGAPGTWAVAYFEAPESDPALFNAFIGWGDGSRLSSGTINAHGDPNANGLTNFSVTGTHTYASEGAFTFAVQISDVHSAVTVQGTARIASAAPLRGRDFAAVAGQAFTTVVADFEGGGSGATAFPVTIDGGDGGARSAGTIADVGDPDGDRITNYEVSGSHRYAAAGSYRFAVDVDMGELGPHHTEGTATVTANPGPRPEPGPAPGGPIAQVALVKAQVKQGEVAILDASKTTGQIKVYAFDINGNGTYETKCAGPYAGTIHASAGEKPLGVKAVGVDGTASVAGVPLKVGGGVQSPPKGKKSLLPGTITGGCLRTIDPAAISAAFEALMSCPPTVQVGVAEATIPREQRSPPLSGDPCFKRNEGPKVQLKVPGGPLYPRFIAQQKRVDLNGIEIDTNPLDSFRAGVNKLVIVEPRQTITTEYPGYGGGDFTLRAAGLGAISTSPDFKFGTLDVSKPGIVGTFPIAGYYEPRFLGLPVVAKDVPITFTANRETKLRIFVAPPFAFSSLAPGNSPTGQPLDLIADNTQGLRIEGGSIVAGGGGTYNLDLPLGIFHLAGTLHYANEGGSNVWSGNVNLRIPDTNIDNINGYIRFRDGNFEFAKVAAPFKRPGLGPIGCCVYLEGLEGQLTPYAIQAVAAFAAGPELIGDFRAAEAVATMSIQYSPFILAFKADQLRIAKWDVNANTFVVITPNKFLTSAFWVGDLAVLSWKLNVETLIANPWYVAGGGTACAGVWPLEGCVNVYGAAGPKGVTVCAGIDIGIGDIEGGIRVPWNPFSVDDYSLYDGCSFDKVKAKVSAAMAARLRATASAAGRQTGYPVQVPAGLRAALFVIEGRGAQPRVSLRGPGGISITTPPPEQATAKGGNWLAIRQTNDNTVRVIVAKPAAGRWRVQELAGSPAVKSIDLAPALPERLVTGRVSGSGGTRTLQYRLARTASTKVTFVERGGAVPRVGQGNVDPQQVVDEVIGEAKASQGRIHFTPAEGKVRTRRIEAVVESQGTPIKTEVVARFAAPRFRLPSAPRVRATRDGNALLVRWGKITGARRYQVFVNQSTGPTRYFSRPARTRSLRIRGVGATASATAQVRAVSPAGYIGRFGRASLKRLPAVSVPRRLRAAQVLRRGGFTARCTAAGDGRCEITVKRRGRILARGARMLSYTQTRQIAVKLTSVGRNALRKARNSHRTVVGEVVATVPGVALNNSRVTFR